MAVRRGASNPLTGGVDGLGVQDGLEYRAWENRARENIQGLKKQGIPLSASGQ